MAIPSKPHDESDLAVARNLLFGLLAFQNGFIDRDALLGAFNAWVVDRSRPLSQLLLDRGAIDAARRDLLEALVREHLRLHGGDPEKSLASLGSSVEPVMSGLSQVPAADVQVNIASVGRDRHDPDATPLHTPPPRRIGERFRILKLHAEGGLGRVYEAEDQELGRKVALKEIRPDKAQRTDLRSRFVLEAEISGGLQHPGIVPIYSLGSYDDGKPFYAMRFIEGQSLRQAIAAYHWAHPQPDPTTKDFRDLLNRFLDICNAIAFAHSRGVLHRDLKPHNVMIGNYGEALIIDWGLAKATGKRDPSSGRREEPTLAPPSGSGEDQTLGAIGTPGYMSPEAAAGRIGELGPASDVYGLGAILYHLLTGQAPIRGAEGEDLLPRVIRGEIASARALNPNVPIALEAICSKALALKPENRYPTARALADDLARWMADEPISVYRGSLGDRAGRWARRHKPVVAGLATLLVTGLVASAVGLVVVDRARDAKEQARQKLRATLDTVSSEVLETLLTRQERLTETQKAFLRTVLGNYEEFAREEGTRPETRAEVAAAHRRMGDIRRRLGEAADAERAHTTALVLYSRLCDEYPDRVEYHVERARAHLSLGSLLNTLRRQQEGEEQFSRATEAAGRLAASSTVNPDHVFLLASAESGLADSLAEQRKNEAAEAHFLKALKRLTGLTEQHPGEFRYRLQLANCEYSFAILLNDVHRPAEAVAHYRTSIRLFEEMVKERPDPEVRLFLSSSLINTAHVLERSPTGLTEADELYARGLKIQEDLVRQYGAVPFYRLRLGRTYMALALSRESRNRPDEAESLYRRSLEVRGGLASDFGDQPEFWRDLGSGHYQLGRFLHLAGRLQDAETEYLEALKVQERLVDQNKDVAVFAAEMSRTLGNLGHCALTRRDANEAERRFVQTLRVQQDLVKRGGASLQDRLEIGLSYENLAAVAGQLRQDDLDALEWTTKAVEHFRSLDAERPNDDPTPPELARLYRQRAGVHDRLKQYPEAIQDWDEAIARDKEANRPNLRILRAATLVHAGKHDEAVVAADELARTPGATPEVLYNGACVCALAAGAVGIDAELVDRYAFRAVELLREAVDAGYKDASRIENDSDLDAVRKREGYRQLMRRLKGDIPAEKP